VFDYRQQVESTESIDIRAKEVQNILKRMREIRDHTYSVSLRSEYNAVCDRLDVLYSKIIESR